MTKHIASSQPHPAYEDGCPQPVCWLRGCLEPDWQRADGSREGCFWKVYPRTDEAREHSRQVVLTLLKRGPTRPVGKVVAEGDDTCLHALWQVPWAVRLGAQATGFTGRYATYHNLYRCDCGREVVTSVRALV